MALAQPKHDAVWARELIAELTRRGLPVKDLLSDAGLSESSLSGDDARIPFAKHARLFELAAEATHDDCLGLHFGQTRHTGDAGLIGYVGLSSPSLMDAIENLCRYRRVFSDAIEVQMDVLQTHGRLCWQFRDGSSEWAHQAREFSASNLIRAFRAATGSPIVPVAITFAHPRTKNVDAFERFFGCPVRFGGPGNIIEIGLTDLDRPLVHADNRLLELLRRYCQDILSRRPEPSSPLFEKVQGIIAQRLTTGPVKLDLVASEMGMSSRSLSRRLAESGASFSGLVENVRKQLAHQYLHESNLSCTQIAFLLGYSDVSSFNYAFKRWSGQTPTAARKSMLA